MRNTTDNFSNNMKSQEKKKILKNNKDFMVSDDIEMSRSISIYDQSVIMDENSPHKNIRDIVPGPNSNSFMNL